MEFPTGSNHLLFELGSIIFIKKYEYEDGGEPTDKLLIVLDKETVTDKITYLTFTLTTSQLTKYGIIPEKIKEGCSDHLQYPYHHFHYFKKGKKVGKDGYSFEDDTIILVQNNIRHRDCKHFDKYSSSKYEIKHLDCLTN